MLLSPLLERGLNASRFDTAPILKKVALASRKLAELKGIAGTIPNEAILINTLGIQEAKDSSEIENIVTTHDELFKRVLEPEGLFDPASKEVLSYRQALSVGFEAVRKTGLLTNNHILEVQARLEHNNAGFRRLPGTTLKNNRNETVYTPPQDAEEIVALMSDLERFINNDALFDADPLIKMAIIHHHFESMHPFYDGNGRTGRIINILYLTKQNLLETPVLYLSRYIVKTKREYYRLLQLVRTDDCWEEWILYLLIGIEQMATEGIETIKKIKTAFLEIKQTIRSRHSFYSQDLINDLFNHPYTKIEFIESNMNISRPTAAKYLEALTQDGILEKRKIGRANYYMNKRLVAILTRDFASQS